MSYRTTCKKAALALAIAAGIAGTPTASALVAPASPAGTRANAAFAIPFVENRGRHDDRVAYYADTLAGTVFVTRAGEVVYDLPQRTPGAASGGWTLVESLSGAMPLTPQAGDRAATRVTRFDDVGLAGDAATYRRVSLGEAWNGVDVWLQAHADNVEKFFSVRAGADAASIRVAVRGTNTLRAGADGTLVAATDAGDVAFSKPVAWQEIDGERRSVEVAYAVHGREYGFALGAYDARHAVVIDPILQSTFVGGSGWDRGYATAIHPVSGEVYVAGTTTSSNFPGTAGGARPYLSAGGSNDFAIARLDASLTTLLQSTYLGRAWESDDLTAIAVHPTTGEVYVAGYTSDKTFFPGATGGAQATSGGLGDAVVARLDANLTTLYQSTFYGGSAYDYGFSLAIAPDTGDVYLSGHTYSANLPGVAGGAQSTYRNNADAFVARFDASLTTLVQATYLGGTGSETLDTTPQGSSTGLAIHPLTGEIYLAGNTTSMNFPGLLGSSQPWGGGVDAYIARFNPQLTTLLQSTWYGTSADDRAYGIAIHPVDGDVYIVGDTRSTALAGTAGGARPTASANGDAYVARFSADLTTLQQATYLGGTASETARAIVVDPLGTDVYVAGNTTSTNLPGRTGAAEPTFAGGTDGFVSRSGADLKTLVRTTYLGGAGDERLRCIALHPFNGDLYVAGETFSTTYPATAGGARPTNAGGAEMVLSRLTPGL